MKDDLLLPFEDDVQHLLKQVDHACMLQQKRVLEASRKAKLAGQPLEVDMETLVWTKIIKAYGILFNRAVDAGWIQDIMLVEAPPPDDEEE